MIAPDLSRLYWAVSLNLVVALLAYKRRGVSVSGALAGWCCGSLVLWLGGWSQWILLMAFFLSAMLTGRFKRKQKSRAESQHHKGYRRDAVQVFANTGPALIFIGLSLMYGRNLLVLAAASFAAATADTWASDLGMLSRRMPVSILNGRPVERGSSGGVSPLGFAVSLAGSLFIAVLYLLLEHFQSLSSPKPWLYFCFIAVGGFCGSLLDSVLGAALQAKYRCAVTGKLTEKPKSGQLPNQLVGGLALMTNDLVNFLATTGSASLVWLAGWRLL